MEEKNIVIGIEGLVGTGKTSISRQLLKYIPNSIILHGGNIYRAIVFSIMQSGINLTKEESNLKNIDALEIMKKLDIDIKLENRETQIYVKGKKVKEEDLQSDESSIAVSKMSNVADNTKLYKFGKELIDSFRKNYNVILSSRDIMKMYPETTYHFFIKANLEERVNRKYIQYKGEISKKQIEETIKKRDELQEKSGYYKIYDKTQIIDVTNCKNVEESTNEVLKHIKLEISI